MNFLNKLKKVFSRSAAFENNLSDDSITKNVNKKDALPDVTASVTGTLTSYNLVVLISASSDILGATYCWNGPLGFISRQQNVFVTEPGTYTVKVTNPANGRTNNTSVVVVKEPEPSIDDIKQHQLDLIHALKERKNNKKKKRKSTSTK